MHNKSIAKSMIRKGWNVGEEKLYITEVGGSNFLFNMKSKDLFNYILEESLWHITSKLLHVQQ